MFTKYPILKTKPNRKSSTFKLWRHPFITLCIVLLLTSQSECYDFSHALQCKSCSPPFPHAISSTSQSNVCVCVPEGSSTTENSAFKMHISSIYDAPGLLLPWRPFSALNGRRFAVCDGVSRLQDTRFSLLPLSLLLSSRCLLYCCAHQSWEGVEVGQTVTQGQSLGSESVIRQTERTKIIPEKNRPQKQEASQRTHFLMCRVYIKSYKILILNMLSSSFWWLI